MALINDIICPDLLNLIAEYLTCEKQVKVSLCSKYFYGVKIIDFYNFAWYNKSNLSDTIIKNYKKIKYLDARGNSNITDEGIKHMQLKSLDASDNQRSQMKVSNICNYTLFMFGIIQILQMKVSNICNYTLFMLWVIQILQMKVSNI